MLRVIEFFAGIGCVHEGFRQNGLDYEIVARAEISPKKDRMYEELWGSSVPKLGDVTAIDDLPEADFWHFSSPCQDLSVSGRCAMELRHRRWIERKMLRSFAAIDFCTDKFHGQKLGAFRTQKSARLVLIHNLAK